MKAKKIILFSIAAIITMAFSLYSCKKNDTSTTTSATVLDQSDLMNQSVSDDQTVQDAQNTISKDVTDYMSGLPLAKGNSGDTVIPCGIVTTATPANNTYHIKYTATMCDENRSKKGNITIQLINGKHWSDTSAQIKITYNVTITIVSTEISYTLKGSKIITNVNGGLLLGARVDSNKSIYHTINGTDTIIFPYGTTRIWSNYVKKTWQYTSGCWNISITGLGTDATSAYTQLINWGINRNGDNFYTQIISPIKSTGTCDFFPCGGQISQTIVSTSTSESANIVITYGVDVSGNSLSSGCSSYYKYAWTAKDGIIGAGVLHY